MREDIFTEETPTLLKHCVRAVAQKHGGDTKKAFAICTAQLQRSGYLEKGSQKLTAKGKEAEKKHAADPDAKMKLSDYEGLLKANRKKEEGLRNHLTSLRDLLGELR